MGLRLRRHYKNYKRSKMEDDKDNEKQSNDEEPDVKVQKPKSIDGKPIRPVKMIKQLMENPNFTMQLMVILLSLTSDHMQMDRKIDGMTTTIEKVRTITELVNKGMSSMKIVTEVPKNIRRLLE